MGRSTAAGRLLRAARRGVCAALGVAAVGCATVPVSRVDALMRDYSGNVPGASVLVVHDGEIAFRKSYGMANLEHTAATPDTNYRLASVTKQFTAASILLLGIPLDDPITKYLPSLPS